MLKPSFRPLGGLGGRKTQGWECGLLERRGEQERECALLERRRERGERRRLWRLLLWRVCGQTDCMDMFYNTAVLMKSHFKHLSRDENTSLVTFVLTLNLWLPLELLLQLTRPSARTPHRGRTAPRVFSWARWIYYFYYPILILIEEEEQRGHYLDRGGRPSTIHLRSMTRRGNIFSAGYVMYRVSKKTHH